MSEKNKDIKKSEEYLSSLNSGFDYQGAIKEWQQGGGVRPMLSILQKHYKAPTPELTPEQIRRAKMSASITDGLREFAKMFAHGKGAYIRNDNGQSSTKTTNKRLKEIQDKYAQDSLRYNLALAGTEEKDFLGHLKDKQQKYQNKHNVDVLKYKTAKADEDRERDKKDKIDFFNRQIEAQKQQDKWRLNNVTLPAMTKKHKYTIDEINKRGSYSGRNGQSNGYVSLQDNSGSYMNIPTDQWLSISQDIYGLMTSMNENGNMVADNEKAMLTSLSNGNEPIDPKYVAGYVLQNQHKIPQWLWDKIEARLQQQGYNRSGCYER